MVIKRVLVVPTGMYCLRYQDVLGAGRHTVRSIVEPGEEMIVGSVPISGYPRAMRWQYRSIVGTQARRRFEDYTSKSNTG